MTEYRFDLDKAVPPGRVDFQLSNRGRLPHDLVLVPLPEDAPPLTFEPHATAHTALSTLAVVPRLSAGANDLFAVDLDRGRYALICFVSDSDGVQHSTKGMHTEFRVQ